MINTMGNRERILYLGIFAVFSAADGYKKWSCFIPYFKAITQRVSTVAAMAEAKRLEKSGAVSDCHLFSHVIGETSVERYNFDMGQAFSSCEFGCSDGCFHGVMERYVRYTADPSNVASKVPSMCDSVGTDLVRTRQCIHGIGHGLIAHGFLPLQNAIAACESLDQEWQLHCIGGLTMEHIDQYLERKLSESDFKAMLPGLCAPFESTEPSFKMNYCLFQVALGVMYYTGHNVEHSRKLCEELYNQEYVRACKNYITEVVAFETPANIDVETFLKNTEVF